MKQNYEALEMEVIRFEQQDIVTQSGGDIDKFEEDEGLEDF